MQQCPHNKLDLCMRASLDPEYLFPGTLLNYIAFYIYLFISLAISTRIIMTFS